jgi:branched-chain amino acid transport system substrate-binding protein
MGFLSIRNATIICTALLILQASCKKSTNTDYTTVTTGADAVEEIVIGEVGSLTGNDAVYGTSTHEGVLLAVKQINEKGGIKGKRVRVVVLDNQGKPEEAATAITKLITQDKVKAVIGEVASTRSLAMAPIAQQNKVPMISPSSTNPDVTKKGDYIFRVCFIDPFQGAVMARFAKETLGLKKVAILKDVKNDYSIGLSDFFKETFTKLGGQIVGESSYSSSDVDFKSQLTSIKAMQPEAIFVPGYYTEVGLIARQAKELGLNMPLLGGDGWDSEKLREIGGSALNGSYFSNHYSPDDQSEAVQAFIKSFRKDYGKEPDSMAAGGYDAANILFAAMERAPSLDGPAVRAALSETKGFKGATGVISLDANRDAVKSAVIIEIKNESFHYKQTIEPGSA